MCGQNPRAVFGTLPIDFVSYLYYNKLYTNTGGIMFPVLIITTLFARGRNLNDQISTVVHNFSTFEELTNAEDAVSKAKIYPEIKIVRLF